MFQNGVKMTRADLEAGVILAPLEAGRYKLYVLDDQGKIIMESKGTLEVNSLK